MKIVVPSETDAGLASVRSGHFGHAAYFTVVTVEDGEVVDAQSVKNVDHDEVGCGGVIDFCLSLGVDAILVVGMGRPPLMRFTQGGVTVYTERETPLVGDVIKRFVAGEVPTMLPEQACSHH